MNRALFAIHPDSSVKRGTCAAVRRARRGFTIAELLVALVLTAMLMMVLGGALNAALMAYDYNTQQTSLVQAAKVLSERISREIRQAEDVTRVSSTHLRITPIDQPSVRINYYFTNGELRYQRTVSGQGSVIVLMDANSIVRCTAMQVRPILQNAEHNRAVLVSAQMTLQTQDGQVQPVTISGALRQNQ